MFCVECGREEPELIGSLCRECYSKKHIVLSLPDHVDVLMCAHCSSMLNGGKWEDVGSLKDAAQIALGNALVLPDEVTLSEMRVGLSEKDERNMDAKVLVMISSHGMQFEREISTIVRLKRGSCTECSKQHGNYYEAIIQLRGDEKAPPERAQMSAERLIRDRVASMRRSSRRVFISKVTKVKGGLDFYFSTGAAARSVARELHETMCTEYKESSSLWGQRAGEEIYRMTFLIRLPGYGRGDVVTYDSKDYYIRSMSHGTIHAFDLLTGEPRPIRVKGPDECVLAREGSEIPRVIVLYETDREVQVLDPDTMMPLDLRKPAGFRRDGEQVRLAKTKLGAYVLSDSW